MSYRAEVVTVMIASPGDVPRERVIATQVILDWNYENADARRIVLQPYLWESSLPAQLEREGPQPIINEYLLSNADIVIGIFKARIGTRTERFPGGAVEEVERNFKKNKPTMVYFCDTVPESVEDQQQLAGIREFRKRCESMGIIGTYRTCDELEKMLRRHLTQRLNRSEFIDLNRLSLKAEFILQAASFDSDCQIWCDFSGNDPHIATDTVRVSLPDTRTIYDWQKVWDELVKPGHLRKRTNKTFEITDKGEQYLKQRSGIVRNELRQR
jgi:hypothetical protein